MMLEKAKKMDCESSLDLPSISGLQIQGELLKRNVHEASEDPSTQNFRFSVCLLLQNVTLSVIAIPSSSSKRIKDLGTKSNHDTEESLQLKKLEEVDCASSLDPLLISGTGNT
ncbi:hypothetical protein KP509_30G022800 [Ceratopteris richardii]|uniref:Uncharacterized protein n=1 Tax=Ceratopteris richardii TaxID=49495 RepID=A0A8T2R1S0_CERRI|nr:hypothetical protein KP509_30G022800 [Ceratopteris richardii]